MFTVKLTAVVTKDGKPFASFAYDYENLDYSDLVDLEALGIKAGDDLVKLAREREAKKNK